MRASDLTNLSKFYLRRWLGISSGRKVLDVGSGHRPHEDATHLLDLLFEDNSERGKPIKRLGRPLVLGTVESLPYKDKAFDYVYASHILEHTEDPATACEELMRIGRGTSKHRVRSTSRGSTIQILIVDGRSTIGSCFLRRTTPLSLSRRPLRRSTGSATVGTRNLSRAFTGLWPISTQFMRSCRIIAITRCSIGSTGSSSKCERALGRRARRNMMSRSRGAGPRATS